MNKNKRKTGYIGVDFDGTLSMYDRYRGPSVTGDPVVPMVNRVKRWLAQGKKVVIFTARVAPSHSQSEIDTAISAIEDWCMTHIGQKLEITAIKYPEMYEFWDDKAIGVYKNTGNMVY